MSELCRLIDPWKIYKTREINKDVWDYIKKEKDKIDFEENYIDDCSIDDIREFVGEGICLEDKELSDIWKMDIWYNVSIEKSNSSWFKGDSLFIEFLADESMCEKI